MTTLAFSTDLPQINKCCPRGQKFDIYLKCVPIENEVEIDYDSTFSETDGDGDSLSWFPVDSVVNSTTLKIHEHHRDLYLSLLQSNFIINYGQMPNCSSEQATQVAYFKKDVLEIYNFILYENETMRIHISKPGSFHNPSQGIWHFPVIQRDQDIDLPLPKSSTGKIIITFNEIPFK
ncbi:hypothetical protein RUM43_014678 [Polyplax serrata]|uniref:Uncharacterized protein n=1 Tax=Polyplax serrata TaxID=468196 RepID=A0AAN8NPE8_POLSC